MKLSTIHSSTLEVSSSASSSLLISLATTQHAAVKGMVQRKLSWIEIVHNRQVLL
jgi:hypothetical protein